MNKEQIEAAAQALETAARRFDSTPGREFFATTAAEELHQQASELRMRESIESEESKLVAFFRSEQGAALGREGDRLNLSPAEMAIRAMTATLAKAGNNGGQGEVLAWLCPENDKALSARQKRDADGYADHYSVPLYAASPTAPVAGITPLDHPAGASVAAVGVSQAETPDPLDMKLTGEVRIGHTVFGKGVHLRSIWLYAQRLFDSYQAIVPKPDTSKLQELLGDPRRSSSIPFVKDAAFFEAQAASAKRVPPTESVTNHPSESPISAESTGTAQAAGVELAAQDRIDRHKDIILQAIDAYDQYMLDDDFDAQGCMDRIIAKMRERLSFAAPHPASAESGGAGDMVCPHGAGSVWYTCKDCIEAGDGERLRYLIEHHEKPLWNLLWNGHNGSEKTIRDAIDKAKAAVAERDGKKG